MHTELTVCLLEARTGELAAQFRVFMEVTCQAYETVETAKEYAARLKKSASTKESTSTPADLPDDGQNPTSAKESTSTPADPPDDGQNPTSAKESTSTPADPPKDGQSPTDLDPKVVKPLSPAAPTGKGKRKKTFNIQTYKYHALADYADHIRRFGTTDSYSTERVRSFSSPTSNILISM
jgi:hypothetical protein